MENNTNLAEAMVNRMVTYCLAVAKSLIEQDGDFFPFASSVDVAENLLPVAIPPSIELQNGEVILNMLHFQLKEKMEKGNLKGFALCFHGNVANASFPKGVDAIIIRVKTIFSSDQLHFYFPYQKGVDKKAYYKESWIEVE